MATISPPPVYAEDTSLTELGTAELFIVTISRLWVAQRGDPENPGFEWKKAFAAAGIEKQGVPAFECFMEIVASTAMRTILVRPLRCRMLGRDEARLLQLVSLLQRGRVDAAVAILTEWLPAAAVRLAERVAVALANALRDAKLIVPLPHAEAGAVRRLALNAHATPGLALIH